MKRPTVYFDSRGESGNIFFILRDVRQEFQRQRRITDYNNLWERVLNSGSYDAALAEIRKEIDLIDIRGEK